MCVGYHVIMHRSGNEIVGCKHVLAFDAAHFAHAQLWSQMYCVSGFVPDFEVFLQAFQCFLLGLCQQQRFTGILAIYSPSPVQIDAGVSPDHILLIVGFHPTIQVIFHSTAAFQFINR